MNPPRRVVVSTQMAPPGGRPGGEDRFDRPSLSAQRWNSASHIFAQSPTDRSGSLGAGYILQAALSKVPLSREKNDRRKPAQTRYSGAPGSGQLEPGDLVFHVQADKDVPSRPRCDPVVEPGSGAGNRHTGQAAGQGRPQVRSGMP